MKCTLPSGGKSKWRTSEQKRRANIGVNRERRAAEEGQKDQKARGIKGRACGCNRFER